MLFAELARVSDAVAATSKRGAKIAELADLLRRLAPEEVPVAIGVLTGVPRQGRIGVGWATLSGREAGSSDPRLGVGEVDRLLDAVVATSGAGSVQRRHALLDELFARATPPEANLLRGLLTGELRQGALAGVMTDAVAVGAGVPVGAVRRAAMLAGSLADAAQAALRDGEAGLAAIDMVVLRPVQPMLAASATGVDDALAKTGPAAVEWKLDGARIQVHRLGDEVRIYTRNLNDVTDRLPGVVAAARGFAARSFVLDGEALGLDDEGRPHAFQDTMSRFGAEAPGSGATLRALFFDLLTLQDRSLLDAPLGERRHLLGELVGAHRVPGVETDEPSVAHEVLAEALAHGHEGVVVKSLDSPYEAGRRGGSWRKVKPVTTLDLVVLAAEWGHGRRTGWLSNLHLGALDPEGDFGEPGGLVMVGKTFKGLTDELLTWQTEQLQHRAVARHGHVVEVRRELVVEIALDGVQVSRRYPGGVALRFARVRGYRPDKDPGDADTIATVRRIGGLA